MKKSVIVAATLFASSLIAGTASANELRFAYSEKDLSSPEAVASLHQRIESRAKSYCLREYLKTKDLKQNARCVDDVVAQITSGIDGGRRIAGLTSEQPVGS